jgi:hypothetical protein
MIVVILWQWITVTVNYGGNWTGIYCTGALSLPPPPELAREHIYRFADSYGYDGQFYHYMAHDPFLGRGFSAHIDAPGMRYRRILIPLMAYLVAFGQDRWIDAGYIVVVVGFAGLGTYWLSRMAQRYGYHSFVGLGFLMVPAVLVSVDRLTIDIALAACCVGFALYAGEPAGRWKLLAVLLLASLDRETGGLLVAAAVLYYLAIRRWREAVYCAAAAIPALAWYLFAGLHTRSNTGTLFSPALFLGLMDRFLHPYPYRFPWLVNAVASALDLLALAGIVTAVVWTVRRALGRAWNPVTVAACLFAALAAVMAKGEPWAEAYAFGRTLTPLLVLCALDGFSVGSWVPGLGMMAVVPRIGLQWAHQVLGVAERLIHVV